MSVTEHTTRPDSGKLGTAANVSSANNPAEQDNNQYIAFDLRKVAISCFLFWQIYAVSIWVLPDQGARLGLGNLVRWYMLATGEWQQWTMFSPQPASINFYIDARIEYADGVVKMWHFPRVRDMDMVERYQRERYRKMTENAYLDASRKLWPDLARYVALENDRAGDPAAYPMTVHLIRHVQQLPPYPMPIKPAIISEFYETTFESSPAAALGKHE